MKITYSAPTMTAAATSDVTTMYSLTMRATLLATLTGGQESLSPTLPTDEVTGEIETLAILAYVAMPQLSSTCKFQWRIHGEHARLFRWAKVASA